MTMPDHSQYAAAAHVPLIKSPSVRIPKPVELPPDIHPLPDSVTAYFVYPFTLEPHTLTTEAARRATIAAHVARSQTILKQREDEKERRRKEALRRVAPGWEGSGSLVPDRVNVALAGSHGGVGATQTNETTGKGGDGGVQVHARQKSVMEDWVDQLEALDAASSSSNRTETS